MKKVYVLLIFFIFSIKSISAQVLNSPIKYKVGQVFRYELKQKNVGGILGGEFYSSKTFQIKVISQNSKIDSSYILEWRYTTFITALTDTIKDELAIAEKKLLLKSSLRIHIDKRGRWRNFTDTSATKRQWINHYIMENKLAKEPGMFDFRILQINDFENFEEYLEAFLPEIKVFFSAYNLLPANLKTIKKDTTQSFAALSLQSGLDTSKYVAIPKTIYSVVSNTNPNYIKISYSGKVHEKELKTYLETGMRAEWDKMGLKKEDTLRVMNEEMLNKFQPKLSESYEVIFDKKLFVPIRFTYIMEDWLNLLVGSSLFYNFKQL